MSRAGAPAVDLSSGCDANLRAILERNPRVHCISNAVTMALTANVLLAVGAIPSMSMSPSEVTAFVASAQALSINIGTLDDERREAILLAVRQANKLRQPWVLDPVFVERSPARRSFALEMMSLGPAVVRGNGCEIAALLGDAPDGSARLLAERYSCVVVQTGREDLISNAEQGIIVSNGDALMERVTGMGCAVSALVAAFLAVEEDHLAAASQALLAVGIAGQRAGNLAQGPGSFQTAWLDELYRLDAAALSREAQTRRA